MKTTGKFVVAYQLVDLVEMMGGGETLVCGIVYFCVISPIHTNDSKAVSDEPASVVTSSFTLQGSRGGSTAVHLSFLWQSFVYMFKKCSEHNRRRSKMVKADAIRQKFQVGLNFRIEIKLRTMMSRSRITAKLCLNCAV